nr:CoA pyrophosphatase [Qingshengfaniella alkalisoli]
MTADVCQALERALALQGGPSSDFDLNPDVQLHEGRKLRPASVLIALEESPSGFDVLLTKRTSHLKHHPGQISFPGGKLEPDDATPEICALREAEEEIGLPRDAVRVMGRLPDHETVTGFQVTPVVGRITTAFAPVPELGEVAEIFRVPFSFLVDPSNFRVEARRWRGQRRQYFVVPWGPYYIWGATARMLHSLAERYHP